MPPTVLGEADGTVLLFCLDVAPVISVPCQLKPERPCNVANVTPTPVEANHPSSHYEHTTVSRIKEPVGVLGTQLCAQSLNL